MNSLIRTLSSAVLIVLIVSFFTANASEETAAEAWSRIDAGAVLIDVRSAQEFEDGHLEGAINIEYTQIDALSDAIGNLDRSVVVYCRSGRRSGKAMEDLKKRGFNNVYNGLGYQELNARARATR
jgi:phage shock protein E